MVWCLYSRLDMKPLGSSMSIILSIWLGNIGQNDIIS